MLFPNLHISRPGVTAITLGWLSLTSFVVADIVVPAVYGNASDLSEACHSILTTAVNCDASLGWTTDINMFYTPEVLGKLCTSTCATALDEWLGRVKAVCGTSRYSNGDGYSYLASYGVELALERYKVICLQNSAGQNCNSVIGKLAGVDPSNQKSTASPQSNMACDGCAISLLKTRLEMPLMSDKYLSGALSVITSSCKTTVAVATPSSVAWFIPATTSATATSSTPTHTNGCDGKIYTVKQGDTCLSVSLSQGINTIQLLATNDLIAGCSNFPQSGSLCIPTVWTCKPHQIKDGETCNTIAKASNVTWVQLISWNAELGKSCENIARLGNSAICISTPGGPWVDPFPSSSIPSGISTTPDTVFTLPMTTLPTSAMVPSISVSTIWGDNDEL